MITEPRLAPKFINYAKGLLASCYNLLYFPNNTAAHRISSILSHDSICAYLNF